jgi:hypothetical protein
MKITHCKPHLITLLVLASFLITTQYASLVQGQTYDGPPPPRGSTSDGPSTPQPTRPSSPVVIVRESPRWDPFPPPQRSCEAPKPEKILSKEGPQFAPLYSMSTLSFEAFVKGDWPLVIDFEPLETSIILFSITTDGAEPFTYQLDGSRLGRRQQLIRIPGRLGLKPTVARYSLSAFSPGLGEQKPARFVIYGFAAGDKAVGSIGIDQVKFAPGSIRPRMKEKANYDFHSLFDFSKVSAEFLVIGLHPQTKEIISKLVRTESISGGISRNKWVSKDWDGKNDKGAVSTGHHQVHIRAWRSLESGGDWASAWSPEVVKVVQ